MLSSQGFRIALARHRPCTSDLISDMSPIDTGSLPPKRIVLSSAKHHSSFHPEAVAEDLSSERTRSMVPQLAMQHHGPKKL